MPKKDKKKKQPKQKQKQSQKQSQVVNIHIGKTAKRRGKRKAASKAGQRVQQQQQQPLAIPYQPTAQLPPGAWLGYNQVQAELSALREQQRQLFGNPFQPTELADLVRAPPPQPDNFIVPPDPIPVSTPIFPSASTISADSSLAPVSFEGEPFVAFTPEPNRFIFPSIPVRESKEETVAPPEDIWSEPRSVSPLSIASSHHTSILPGSVESLLEELHQNPLLSDSVMTTAGDMGDIGDVLSENPPDVMEEEVEEEKKPRGGMWHLRAENKERARAVHELAKQFFPSRQTSQQKRNGEKSAMDQFRLNKMVDNNAVNAMIGKIRDKMMEEGTSEADANQYIDRFLYGYAVVGKGGRDDDSILKKPGKVRRAASDP